MARLHWLSILAVILLTACVQGPFPQRTAPQEQRGIGPFTPMEAPYKVGRPYQIEGQWYYPAEDLGYAEIGTASWYGPSFHGKRTANGEIFDQNAMTAAHRTLPMPSAVRVTNLENGRSVVLRINDRGPFARNRIIDVSQHAARLLDFEQKGTARVKVEILHRESLQLKVVALNSEAAKGDQVAVVASPRIPVATRQLYGANGQAAVPGEPDSPAPQMITVTRRPRLQPPELPTNVTVVPVTPAGIYVQVGAFTDFRNALQMRDRVYKFGPAQINHREKDGAAIYRVRLGPLSTIAVAETVLDRVITSGVAEARLIIEEACARTPC